MCVEHANVNVPGPRILLKLISGHAWDRSANLAIIIKESLNPVYMT